MPLLQSSKSLIGWLHYKHSATELSVLFLLLAPGQNQRYCCDEHYHSSRPSEEIGPAGVYPISHDLLVAGNQHNHYQQRRRQKAIDNRREEERANGIDADEVNQHTHQG